MSARESAEPRSSRWGHVSPAMVGPGAPNSAGWKRMCEELQADARNRAKQAARGSSSSQPPPEVVRPFPVGWVPIAGSGVH